MAIPLITTKRLHRIQLKSLCSYYVSATTSPAHMQHIVSKNKSQSQIAQCERAFSCSFLILLTYCTFPYFCVQQPTIQRVGVFQPTKSVPPQVHTDRAQAMLQVNGHTISSPPPQFTTACTLQLRFLKCMRFYTFFLQLT